MTIKPYPFRPLEILIDRAVENTPLVSRLRRKLPDIPIQFIQDKSALKQVLPHSEAKKKLLVTRHQGQALKPCQGLGDYVCCAYHTVSFASNCHYECSYCILQDYLKNNPIMTLYANVEEILAEIESTLQRHPEKTFRIGTGELADSLALDELTELSRELIPFAASQKNLLLELKTKSNCVDNLLDLNHRQKTVVAWSLNPRAYAETEELKTASITERIGAAKLVADCGYPIAFHFDPLLAFADWRDQYQDLIDELRAFFEPSQLAWISLGSLRYTPELKKIVRGRFPHSRILHEELIPAGDGKMRYFIDIRTQVYQAVKAMVDQAFPRVANYLCMETSRVWGQVYGEAPSQAQLEDGLTQRFEL